MVESNNQENTFLSISEAATKSKVTRQAIYVAIKLSKLRARKEYSRWKIHVDDLEDYRNNRYSRSRSRFEGALLFDNEKGLYSVSQTATLLGEPVQRIYYAMRSGKLKSYRKGSTWVITKDAIDEYVKINRENSSNKDSAECSEHNDHSCSGEKKTDKTEQVALQL